MGLRCRSDEKEIHSQIAHDVSEVHNATVRVSQAPDLFDQKPRVSDIPDRLVLRAKTLLDECALLELVRHAPCEHEWEHERAVDE